MRCAASAPSCARHWKDSSAAATPRNTCKSRSSPTVTAGTSSSYAPNTAMPSRASSTDPQRVARACTSSRSRPCRSTTTWSRSRIARRRRFTASCWSSPNAFRQRPEDLDALVTAAAALDELNAKVRLGGRDGWRRAAPGEGRPARSARRAASPADSGRARSAVGWTRRAYGPAGRRHIEPDDRAADAGARHLRSEHGRQDRCAEGLRAAAADGAGRHC